MVSISFEIGLRVSRRSPPIDSTTQTDPALGQIRLDGQKFRRAAGEAIRLSDGQHVTMAQEARTSASLERLATEDTCSLNTLSQPATVRSRCCASSPAVESWHIRRAYFFRLFVRLGFTTL
jgi:hypothetical protein